MKKEDDVESSEWDCHMGDQKGTCEGTSVAGNGQARLGKRTEALGKFWEEKIIEDQLTTLAWKISVGFY